MKSSSSLLSLHPTPVPLCPFSTPLVNCPELDLSVTLGPSQTNVSPCPTKNNQLSCQLELKHCPQGATGRNEKTQLCFEEPEVVTSEPCITLNTLPRLPVRAQMKNSRHLDAHRQWVDLPAVPCNQDSGCLERIELNTTRALKAELQSIQGAQFNSRKAIQETLWRSERTKNLINARATEVVNVSRSQLLYTSLVKVDMQEDQLIQQVLQERLLLAPPSCCHGKEIANGPSHFFMSSHLIRQQPLPPEEESVNIKPLPLSHPIHSTFDLFRRQRCHEASP